MGRTIEYLVGAALLLGVFLLTELRARQPLVRLGIFRSRSLAMANVLGFLAGLVLFGMFYFLSLYLQIVLHFSALKTGFAYLPLALTIIVAAGAASGLVTRFGFKPILTAGMVLSAIGLALFTRISVNGAYVTDVLPGILLVAAGLGFIFVPLSIAAVQGVQPAEIGLASGLINAAQQVGGAIGLAMLSTIATSSVQHLIQTNHGPTAYASSLVGGFQYAFGTSAAILAMGTVLAVALLPGLKPSSSRQIAGARQERWSSHRRTRQPQVNRLTTAYNRAVLGDRHYPPRRLPCAPNTQASYTGPLYVESEESGNALTLGPLTVEHVQARPPTTAAA